MHCFANRQYISVYTLMFMNLNYESHMYGSIKIQVDDSLLASVKFATKGTLKSAFSYLKIPLQN